MTLQAGFSLRGRNPDVLTCIANLSNDEVFTPPEFANRMLDTVAEAWAADHNGANIWADSNVRFLDPCTKSGVFLREITRRLVEGLASEIPDLQTRVDHILTQQVFGIGITQITSLLARRSVYCSKYANGEHSIAKGFATEAGNIWFERLEHTWEKEKCVFCGASKGGYDRGDEMETHAYAFIHTHDITARMAELFGGNMQFDVIIGNPPYQLGSDGGTRDVPIYQHFVEQAKALQPRYLSLVIPARWMASGLGLNEFRKSMLEDKRISHLVDFPSASDVFPGVEIKAGVCFFLWSNKCQGECKVTTIRNGQSYGPVLRNLSEYDVLVRDAKALSILKKVISFNEPSVNTILARDKEFGWTSNFSDFKLKERAGDIPIHYIKKMKRGIGFIERDKIQKSVHLVEKWKVLIPKAFNGGDSIPHQILGKPLIASSPSVCTQSFLFFFVDSHLEAESIASYYSTKFFRFLVSLRKITQDASHSTYSWVPMQRWNKIWNDLDLYLKYDLSKDEQEYIESQIKVMNVTSSEDD